MAGESWGARGACKARILAALAPGNVRARIEHITRNSPSRLAGSANGRRMVEHGLAAPIGCGVAARREELPELVSFPEIKETYGHDPYGLTARGSIGPSLYDFPRYAMLPEGEARWTFGTQLVRARNRLADVLEDCRRDVAATLDRLG